MKLLVMQLESIIGVVRQMTKIKNQSAQLPALAQWILTKCCYHVSMVWFLNQNLLSEYYCFTKRYVYVLKIFTKTLVFSLRTNEFKIT